jgi:hypothetical protein
MESCQTKNNNIMYHLRYPGVKTAVAGRPKRIAIVRTKAGRGFIPTEAAINLRC